MDTRQFSPPIFRQFTPFISICAICCAPIYFVLLAIQELKSRKPTKLRKHNVGKMDFCAVRWGWERIYTQIIRSRKIDADERAIGVVRMLEYASESR
jgi:hypothetical protein